MRLVLGLLTLVSLSGGEPNGTLMGVISCRHGGEIPNASITARDAATGARVSTVTDVNGEYELFLPGGDYSIVVLKTGLETQQVGSFNMQAKSSVSLNFFVDCIPVTVTDSNVIVMTRADPGPVSREPLTSLPVPDFDAPARGLRPDLSSVEAEALRKRLELSPTQTSRILLILQRKQARLVSIDSDRDLPPLLRRKRITTADSEADGQIRRVLSRKQRREYAVASHELAIK
jgi:hypothetical protein